MDGALGASATADNHRGRSRKSKSVTVNGTASQPKLRCPTALNSPLPTKEPIVRPMPEEAAVPPMETPRLWGNAPAIRWAMTGSTKPVSAFVKLMSTHSHVSARCENSVSFS